MKTLRFSNLISETESCGELFTAHRITELVLIGRRSVFPTLRFYYPTRFRNKGFSSTYARKLGSQRQGYEALLKRLYQAGILRKAGVWSKPNGLIVWKGIILFVTNSEELNNIKKRLARELGKK